MLSKLAVATAIGFVLSAPLKEPADAADFPSHELSTATVTGPGALLITPSRSGETLGEAGLTVTVTLLDPAGHPWPNYPAEDVWLDSQVPGHQRGPRGRSRGLRPLWSGFQD